MRHLPLFAVLMGFAVAQQFIANDVVEDYAHVKELLREFYRRSARNMGHDYNPTAISKLAQQLPDDGTEATPNRHIWHEVFENDIVLNVQQAEALLQEKSSFSRGKRQAQPTPSSFWQEYKIPFTFAVNDSTWRNLIRQALRHIESQTCMRFEENGTARDGLKFFRGSGCWSNVGRQGGRQLVSIGYGCENMGIIAHETLHALGLWHEQSREDRDNYVKMSFNWIIRGTEGNFEKRTSANSDNMGQPYDMGSVMHYGPKSFTTDWSYDTIITKDRNFQQTIGQREGISFKDAKMINLRYCQKTCATQLSCQNDGYTDPNNCSQCKCPRGFGGTYCQEVERSSCGQELTATETFQTLKSDPVRANDYCAWRIKAPYGEKVELAVDYISFPCTDSCSSYVEIKYDKVKTATGAHLCCSAPNSSIISEGNDIAMVMRGSASLSSGYLGFTVRYRIYGSVPTTTSTTSTTTTRPTTRATITWPATTSRPTNYSGRWGEWGAWSACSRPCGGCGTRQRVRGCYGGNYRCEGQAVQTQYCNTQTCKGTSGLCSGRLLVPCDLVPKLHFGQKRASIAPCRWSSEVKRDVANSLRGSSFYRNPAVRNEILRRTKRQSDNALCEKKFTYTCPTNLLTIHIDWKTAQLDASDTPQSDNDVVDMDRFYDDLTECCVGYRATDGWCYKV